jgi:ABC-type nitrate/sulfonate/bicarbonate transport system substrate-binding protein
MSGRHVARRHRAGTVVVDLLVVSLVLGVSGLFPAAGAHRVSIGVAGGIQSSSLPIFYAASQGTFARYGVSASVQSLSNDTLAIRGLLARTYDLVFVGVSTAAVAAGRGARIKMIVIPAPHLDFYFLANPTVRTLKEMEGKTLGVSAPGSLAANVSLTLLARHTVDVRKVRIVAIGSDAARASALVAGTIDGALVNALLAVATMARAPKLHVVADTSTELGDDYLRSAVVARDDTIASDAGMLQAVTTALVETARLLQSNRATFVSFVRSQPALPGSAAAQTFDLFARRPSPWYGVDGGLHERKAFDATIQGLVRSGQLRTPITWNQLFDTRFVEGAVRTLGPYRR